MGISIQALWRKLGVGGEWELHSRGYYLIFAHIMGVQGLFFLLTGQIPWPQIIFGLIVVYSAAIGMNAGAHRLWAHRSYKARLPLRVLLVFMQTLSGLGSIYSWARDHRLHHKFCETNGDPHNVSRGIFFTHIGWAMIKEHPEVKEKEKTIDLSDLSSDPLLAFQHKYLRVLDLIFHQVLPILIMYNLWLPSLYMCVCHNYFHFIVNYNIGSLGNSVAHTWTRKPYEKSISSADITWLSLIIVGEGWHNFHHVFPWDYRSTDYGLKAYNWTTVFIEVMAWIGWAYDLKTVPDSVIHRRAKRTGDGSHPCCSEDVHVPDGNETVEGKDANKNKVTCHIGGNDQVNVCDIEPAPWGWGDKDIPEEDVKDTVIFRIGEQKSK